MTDKPPSTWHVLLDSGERHTLVAAWGDEAWNSARREFGKNVVAVATFPPE